jgi:hypothetical protein
MDSKKQGSAPKPKRFLIGCLLFTDTQLLDELAVLHDVFAHQVLQETLACAHQHQQGAAARVVFAVNVQVLAQLLNAVRKQCNLSFGGAGIFRAAAVLSENLSQFLL